MAVLKIVTWNLNSLKVRLDSLLEWLEKHDPDFVGLQEIKMQHHNFPVEAFRDIKYYCAWHGQKTFNGVAALSKHEILKQHRGIYGFDDEQSRAVSIETEYGYFVNLYCPNGKNRESTSFSYKMMWYKHLALYLKELHKLQKRCVVCGDFNIAPEEIDIYDHTLFENNILFTPEERQCFNSILDVGFVDIFRYLYPEKKQYSWWDYREGSFRKNNGARIDHILIDTKHRDEITDCFVDCEPRKEKRPSDHAPVVAEINTTSSKK